jgi:hypothetical protein
MALDTWQRDHDVTPSNALGALVCGFPRGGTTLAAELLRQHPDLAGGFEGGFLLATHPRAFPSLEPFGAMALKGWQLTGKQLDSVCDVDTWAELYEGLRHASPLVHKGERLPRWVIDKTPRYMPLLPEIMDKTPGVPVLVIVRDPRAVLWSWAKRAKEKSTETWIRNSLDSACARYCSFGRGWRNAVRLKGAESLSLVHYERLCLDPIDTARRLFEALSLEFDPSYLSFRSRWPNVYGAEVQQTFIREYETGFSSQTCQRILDLTAAFPEFRFQP